MWGSGIIGDMKYSGRLLLRLPVTLHQRLTHEADAEKVSLNQYLLMLLAMNYTHRRREWGDYTVFAINGCMEKNDQSEFTDEEGVRLLDEFLEWVTARDCSFGGAVGTPSRA